MPVIIPVISCEEGRGVWSSNRKQRKSLQVDQEEDFQQRSDILGCSPDGVRRKKEGKKNIHSKRKRDKVKRIQALGVSPSYLIS